MAHWVDENVHGPYWIDQIHQPKRQKSMDNPYPPYERIPLFKRIYRFFFGGK